MLELSAARGVEAANAGLAITAADAKAAAKLASDLRPDPPRPLVSVLCAALDGVLTKGSTFSWDRSD